MRAALVVGLVWCLFPYGEVAPGFPLQAPRLPEWRRLGLFLLQIVSLSILFTALFNASGGSVPLLLVAHGLLNTAMKLPLVDTTHRYWPLALALAAGAAVVLERRRFLSGTGRVTAP